MWKNWQKAYRNGAQEPGREGPAWCALRWSVPGQDGPHHAEPVPSWTELCTGAPVATGGASFATWVGARCLRARFFLALCGAVETILTLATPLCVRPIFLAAACDRSIFRPFT